MNKFKECNQCPYEFNDKNLEPCKDCVPKKKTNADRIRAMNNRELAVFLKSFMTKYLTLEELEKWLEEEVEG